MKHLKQFIKNTWSGDVTYSDIVPYFTVPQLMRAEHYLADNQELIEGLPEDFKPKNKAEQILQDIVNTSEDL